MNEHLGNARRVGRAPTAIMNYLRLCSQARALATCKDGEGMSALLPNWMLRLAYFCFMLLLAGRATAVARAAEPIATIDGVPVHAIVSPVTLGSKSSNFKDAKEHDEFPIRQKVRLKSPSKKFRILLEGVLVSKRADKSSQKYINVLQGWTGFKCSERKPDGSSLTAERGPLASTHELKQSIVLRLISDGGSSQDVELASLLEAERSGPCTKLMYSFRQSRLYLLVESEQPIRELRFDTQHLDRDYLGFLRVHLVECDDTEFKIRFEEYGEPNDEYLETKITKVLPIGAYLALEDDSHFPFPGDFFVPVGIQLVAGDKAVTQRTLGDLIKGKELKAKVQGLFIFSGFSIPGNPGEKEVGGGGGEQDFQFRFDHVREKRPPIYPNDSGIWFDCRVIMHGTDDGYMVKDASGTWMKSLENLKDLSADHTYEIKFVPNGSAVQFEVGDGGVLSKTWDNVGAFFVTLQP